ncbi:aspartokinase [Salinibacter ruber]|nr:hypothetical protein [Salinibacter ruber]MCS4199596.1 aspartokinase [Salinibacter ruber]
MPDRSFSSTECASRPVRVLKFGGTSVGSADGITNAVRLVHAATETCRPVVVVSAAAGVTDALVQAAEESRADRGSVEAWTRRVGRHYRALAANTLADEALRARYDTALRAELSELRRALQEMAGPNRAAARDVVLAAGERLMVPLLAAALDASGCTSQAVDASTLIRTDAAHGDATVQWAPTRRQVRDWHRTRAAGLPVVTGFVGRRPTARRPRSAAGEVTCPLPSSPGRWRRNGWSAGPTWRACIPATRMRTATRSPSNASTSSRPAPGRKPDGSACIRARSIR